MYAHIPAESSPVGSVPAGHLIRLGLLPTTDSCSQRIVSRWTATLGGRLSALNNGNELQVIQKILS